MIQKFQQGGPQQGGILAQIQQMPKELQQQLMQAFAQWAQQKGLDVNQLLSNPQALEQALGLFIQELLSLQTLAARHGAKLNYIRSLKHQCAEDEELYYYKKGGKVGCGCKKKKENGGEIKKDCKGGSAIQKFKMARQGTDITKNDTIHTKNFGVRSINPKVTKYKLLSNNEYRKLSNDEQLRIHEKDAMRESENKKTIKVPNKKK